MHKVDSPGATAGNEFTNGNAGSGIPRTTLEEKWMNAVQRELVALVTRTGLALTDADDEQISGTVVLTVANLTALRACPVDGVSRYFTMIVRGSASQGDGSGAAYYWDNASADADDGVDTIQPATAPATGRWKRSALLGNGVATTAANQALGTNNTLIANTAFVQAAIAALVNSSPGALDTLKELADALGDDANFATTMTNALALKAPLASPALTGVPTAPTAALGTNTTQLATMAALQSATDNMLESGTGTFNWVGGSNSGTVDVSWQRIGKFVSMLVTGGGGTTDSGAITIQALPAAIRPSIFSSKVAHELTSSHASVDVGYIYGTGGTPGELTISYTAGNPLIGTGDLFMWAL